MAEDKKDADPTETTAEVAPPKKATKEQTAAARKKSERVKIEEERAQQLKEQKEERNLKRQRRANIRHGIPMSKRALEAEKAVEKRKAERAAKTNKGK